jgi:hypothetical protein
MIGIFISKYTIAVAILEVISITYSLDFVYSIYIFGDMQPRTIIEND